jgi:hypothetical protein
LGQSCAVARRREGQAMSERTAAELAANVHGIAATRSLPIVEAQALHAAAAMLLELERELADYQIVLGHCSVIYDWATDGRITKPNTPPSQVIAVAEDLLTQQRDEEVTRLTRDLTEANERRQEAVNSVSDSERELKAEVERLTRENAELAARLSDYDDEAMQAQIDRLVGERDALREVVKADLEWNNAVSMQDCRVAWEKRKSALAKLKAGEGTT